MGDENTKGLIAAARTYASFVKLSHTVFALPFAIAGMVAAYAVPVSYFGDQSGPLKGGGGEWMPIHVRFSWCTLLLILCCMVGARSFAMAVNRILDRKIDALNSRTAQREIPAGVLSLRAAWTFALAAAMLYWFACVALGPVVLVLSPVPILLMVVYPLTKRFTAFCHLVLGLSLGLAPMGAWVAVRSTIDGDGIGWAALAEAAPWLLGGAVMLWVAGFDVIYALQDDEFDREHKLHSIPAALGRMGAQRVAWLIHLFSYFLFFAFVAVLMQPAFLPSGFEIGTSTDLHKLVWAAPFIMFFGMIYQHFLVKPNDLSRVNMAFFTVNGVISVAFGATFILAWLFA